MSSTVVLVKKIDRIQPHPNADRLDLAIVGGWQCVVPKGKYAGGQLVTYIPPDSVLPDALAEQYGVAKYLSKGRVRATKLRGEPSFGLVVDPVGDEGDNVANQLGITKYQPPMKFHAGETEPQHPMFTEYTDLENLRHYPEVLEYGEEVAVTEKIHGTNCRIGYVRDDEGAWKQVAGSRTMQRTHTEGSIYWHPWGVESVQAMLSDLRERAHVNAILFGEVYGKVQGMRYGLPNAIAFRAFDAMIDGKYLNYHDFVSICLKHGVETAPRLFVGAYELATIAQLSKGPSTIPGADHIREGVVVRPTKERTNPKTGRVILKYVSDDYLCGEYDGASE